MAKSKYSFWRILTFHCFSANKVGNGDILCEMRFHVPNNELDIYQEERRQAKTARKAAENKEAGVEEEKKGAEEESSEDEDDMTAAKLFDNKIH